MEFASRQGAVREALKAALDRDIAALETSIHRANETGELRPERDASQTAFELLSILMNAHALFQVKGDPVVFERARAAIHGLVGELDGGGAKPQASSSR